MARSTRCARGRARRARLAEIAVAAVMCLVSSAAVAGDYYLRGGIGLDRPGKANSTDVDCSTTAPAALYGCGTGGDGARLRSAGDFGTVPTVELGLGYAKGAARFELLVEYRPRFEFEGRANFLAPGQRGSAKLSAPCAQTARLPRRTAGRVWKQSPSAPPQPVAQGFAVIALVGDEFGGGRHGFDTALGDLAIMDVSWCQEQDEGPAFRIADSVELGVSAPLGAADAMGQGPLFPPPAQL